MDLNIPVSHLFNYHSDRYQTEHGEGVPDISLEERTEIEIAIRRREASRKMRCDNLSDNMSQSKQPKCDTFENAIDLSNIVFDAERLEDLFRQNRDTILRDPSVQQYIDSQTSHKKFFLKEIESKGLKLKSQTKNPHEGRQQLNY